jgi:hypothetical protein
MSNIDSFVLGSKTFLLQAQFRGLNFGPPAPKAGIILLDPFYMQCNTIQYNAIEQAPQYTLYSPLIKQENITYTKETTKPKNAYTRKITTTYT